MPDDPQEPLEAIRMALELANNGTDKERDMINALFVLYNKDAIADDRERILPILMPCVSYIKSIQMIPISRPCTASRT